MNQTTNQSAKHIARMQQIHNEALMLFWRTLIISMAVMFVIVTIAVIFTNSALADTTPTDTVPADTVPAQISISPAQGIEQEASYIVLFHKDVVGLNADFGVAELSAQLVAEFEGTLHHTYQHSVQGFAADLTPAAVAALEARDDVAGVIPDGEVEMLAMPTMLTEPIMLTEADQQTTQTTAWGLDRVDQRDLPLDQQYRYTNNGSSVHVYTFDTGIRSSHSEFGDRVQTGYSSLEVTSSSTEIGTGIGTVSIDNGGIAIESTEDCNGHGTHVASVIGGNTYGIAKAVTLHPVRVLKCNGGGTWATVLAGLDWLVANHETPAIVNMSLGGPANEAIDQAIGNAINAGITFVVAAGNVGKDACDYTPARLDNAITVGASTKTDGLSSISNTGECVDLFAPGEEIEGAWHSDDNASKTTKGTSLAAAHVTGAAALYLQSNPDSTPAQVLSALVANATADRLTLNSSAAQVGAIGSSMVDTFTQGTPNLLLHTLFGTNEPAPTAVPTTAPTAVPTYTPTATPTTVPPTSVPTTAPTSAPTNAPTTAPTAIPTAVPTATPTNTPPPAPQDAVLLVEPSPLDMTVGDIKTFVIAVNPGVAPVNGAQVHAQVDPAYLRILSVQNNTAHLPNVLDEVKMDATTGTFSYGAGLLDGVVTTPFDLLQVTVEALAPITQTAIRFLDTFPKSDVSAPNGSVLREAHDGTVTISAAAASHATLKGTIGLQGRPTGSSAAKMVPLTVKLYPTGSDTASTSFSVMTDPDASFSHSCIAPGTYDIELTSEHTLVSRATNVALTNGQNDIYLGELVEGDIEPNNHVTEGDLTVLQNAFNRCKNSQASQASSTSFQGRTDLNNDTCTDIVDFGLLAGNFNRQGMVEYDVASPPDVPLLDAQMATIGFEFGVREMRVGDTAQLGIFVTPNNSPVNGLNAHLRFDPTLVEVTKVDLFTQQFTTVLAEPQIDNEAGTIRFSTGLLGNTLSDRFQVAIVHVTLKDDTEGTSIRFRRAFPATNLTGPNGSVLDTMEGVVLTSNNDPNMDVLPEGDEGAQTVVARLFLPIVER